MISSLNFTLRVVAIDDDVQHLKFISTVLSSDQVVVSTVADPHAGLDVVRKERPHLVLVDLMMPGTTGIELLEKILQFDPSAEVILLTGQYSTESAVEAIQKGAADYLTKPRGRREASTTRRISSLGSAQGSALFGTGE